VRVEQEEKAKMRHKHALAKVKLEKVQQKLVHKALPGYIRLKDMFG
jgi:hypothetical protein